MLGGIHKYNSAFPSNNRTIRTYFIGTLEEYDNLESEIKKLSDETGARVYIRVNRRSYEDVALQSLKDLAQILKDKNFQHLKYLVSSAAGKVSSEDCKRWIVDLDELDEETEKKIISLIDSIEPFQEYSKIDYTVHTLHGKHLITSPFNCQKFSQVFPNIDIHKDNPTLLYFNSDKLNLNE